MNNIIKANGEYIVTNFTGKNGTWILVSSKCDTNAKPMQCKDQFRNEKTGEYMTISRIVIYKQAELRLIIAE